MPHLDYAESGGCGTLGHRLPLSFRETQWHRDNRVALVHIGAMRRGNIVHVLVDVLQDAGRRHMERLVTKVHLVSTAATTSTFIAAAAAVA